MTTIRVTWDRRETVQADMEVPEDTPADEIMKLSVERAERGGGDRGELTGPTGVRWEAADRKRFGGRFG